MKPCVLDFETSISKGVHGPSAKDSSNDIYTTIVGLNPNNIIVRHHPKGFKRDLEQESREIVESSTHIVGHNLGFDFEYIFANQWVKDYFIGGGKLWDTQVAEYLLSAQQHKFASLGELQAKYMQKKVKIDRISSLYKKKIGADEIIKARYRCPRLFRLYCEYSRLDGSSTLEVFKAQHARAKKCGMLDIIALYNDYLLSIINMACSGIKIDIPKAQELEREYNLKHLEYLTKAQGILATVWTDDRLPEFNVNSPVHKSCALFGGEVKVKVKTLIGQYKNGKDKYKLIDTAIRVQGMGVDTKLSQLTKQGNYKTDAAVVEKIYRQSGNRMAKEYCSHQKNAMSYTKALNTYVRSFIKLSVDGIMYVNLNNVETVTGRLSSSKPNMQNIAKHNKFGKDLHSLLIAPEGYTCVQADYSQLEVYVMAWLSGDKQLTEDLLNGLDLHCVRVGYFSDEPYETIYKLCKVDNDKVWMEKRSSAKGVGYLMVYGGMPKTIHEETGIELDIIESIFKKEEETYPDAFALGNNVRNVAVDNQKLSYTANIPGVLRNKSKGSRIQGNVELMPIFDKDGNVCYTQEYIRNLGYWRSPTGKMYHFADKGRMTKRGVKRALPFTTPKNYPMQGTAADIQGASSAALTRLCLMHPDKIRQINEVHDSKWFYVNNNHLTSMLAIIKETMEDIPKLFKERFGLDVPFRFPIDLECGPNFAELKAYVLKQEIQTNEQIN